MNEEKKTVWKSTEWRYDQWHTILFTSVQTYSLFIKLISFYYLQYLQCRSTIMIHDQ